MNKLGFAQTIAPKIELFPTRLAAFDHFGCGKPNGTRFAIWMHECGLIDLRQTLDLIVNLTTNLCTPCLYNVVKLFVWCALLKIKQLFITCFQYNHTKRLLRYMYIFIIKNIHASSPLPVNPDTLKPLPHHCQSPFLIL